MAKYSPDTNNREQLLEFAAQTHTAPDGTKMGAVARIQVNSAGNPVENTEGVLLASAARTASVNSSDQTNYNAKGVQIICNVAANPAGAETLTLFLQVKDPVSGAYVATAGQALPAAANGTYVFQVYPAAVETIATSPLFVQGVAVPRTWRAAVVNSGVGSWTYSLGYQYNV